MPIYSPYILPQQRERDSRFRLLVLAWVIITILSVMLLGITISSWRATNRAWADESQISNIPQKYGLPLQIF